MISLYVELAVYVAMFWQYLPSTIPMLALTLTNGLLILGALWLATLGKGYTRLQLYVDDDANYNYNHSIADNNDSNNNEEEDNNSEALAGGMPNQIPQQQQQHGQQAQQHHSSSHCYLYIVRLYFLNFVRLELSDFESDHLQEAEVEGGSAAASTAGDEEDENENENNDKKSNKTSKNTTNKREPTPDPCIIVIELVDKTSGMHRTKLQLDLAALRAGYIRKFNLTIGDGAVDGEVAASVSKTSSQVCHLVKLLFQRCHPLVGVGYVRVRQLSAHHRPLVHLYRVEIQDTALECDALVAHVDSLIDQQTQCYPALTTHTYSPEPFDRKFNVTKLIWDEMALFMLLGLNVLSAMSVSMLEHYKGNQNDEDENTDQLFWHHSVLVSVVAALVVLALALSYRSFTRIVPQYRKLGQTVVTSASGVLVLILGIVIVSWAVKHSVVARYEALYRWLGAYVTSLVLYLLFCVAIVAIDVGIFYHI